MNFHCGSGVYGVCGDDADAGGADVVDASGQLRMPLEQEGGFSFGADRFFGEVMIFRRHVKEIGKREGQL
jgi:hypothetical protein